MDIGFVSKLIQRRVALGLKALTICSSPKIPSSHLTAHLKGFAFLCRSRTCDSGRKNAPALKLYPSTSLQTCVIAPVTRIRSPFRCNRKSPVDVTLL